MKKVNVKIKVQKDVFLPTYATPQSAGADIHCNENFCLAPGERKLIPTGIRVQLPDDCEMQIRPRSGLAKNHGITVLNSPGTIDADYRGEIGILLLNTGDSSVSFEKGDRIAQLVVVKNIVQAHWQIVDSLDSTERGEGGFGHSGK